ncbi:MAG: hypothetical protein RL226_622 [Bacteroidota bacterium]
MKNFKKILIGTLSAVFLIAVGANAFSAYAAPDTTAQHGNEMSTLSASGLSADEAAGLLFMREEEKLARDVYTKMYELWGMPVFQNIARSEQNHMDQIKLLLDRYDLTDPALAPGQFTDPDLQALYDQLVVQGSASLADAMNVGILIEQTDIADLQSRIAQTDNTDIQWVYNNLLNGSYNHLAAFSGEQGSQKQSGNGRGGRPGWAGNGYGLSQ